MAPAMAWFRVSCLSLLLGVGSVGGHTECNATIHEMRDLDYSTLNCSTFKPNDSCALSVGDVEEQAHIWEHWCSYFKSNVGEETHDHKDCRKSIVEFYTDNVSIFGAFSDETLNRCNTAVDEECGGYGNEVCAANAVCFANTINGFGEFKEDCEESTTEWCVHIGNHSLSRCEEAEEDEPWLLQQFKMMMIIIGSVLIAVTIFFDVMRERLEETFNHTDNEKILGHIFAEMTVLGFLGFVTYILSITAQASLKRISEAWLAEGTALSELLESMHMDLFMAMLVFAVLVVVVIYVTDDISKQWCKWEHDANNENALVKLLVHEKLHLNTHGFARWFHLPRMLKTQELEHKLLYLSIRHGFVEPFEKTTRMVSNKASRQNTSAVLRLKKQHEFELARELEKNKKKLRDMIGLVSKIDSDFDFAVYLSKILKNSRIKLIIMDTKAWIFLFLQLAVFWVFYFTAIPYDEKEHRAVSNRCMLLFEVSGFMYLWLIFLITIYVHLHKAGWKLAPRHLKHVVAVEHDHWRFHVADYKLQFWKRSEHSKTKHRGVQQTPKSSLVYGEQHENNNSKGNRPSNSNGIGNAMRRKLANIYEDDVPLLDVGATPHNTTPPHHDDGDDGDVDLKMTTSASVQQGNMINTLSTPASKSPSTKSTSTSTTSSTTPSSTTRPPPSPTKSTSISSTTPPSSTTPSSSSSTTTTVPPPRTTTSSSTPPSTQSTEPTSSSTKTLRSSAPEFSDVIRDRGQRMGLRSASNDFTVLSHPHRANGSKRTRMSSEQRGTTLHRNKLIEKLSSLGTKHAGHPLDRVDAPSRQLQYETWWHSTHNLSEAANEFYSVEQVGDLHKKYTIKANRTHDKHPDVPEYHTHPQVKQPKHPFFRALYGLDNEAETMDKHANLFWFGINTKFFVRFVLRHSLLLMSVYIVLLCSLLPDMVKRTHEFAHFHIATVIAFIFFSTFVPIISILYMVRLILRDWTVVFHIELFKDRQIVNETALSQRAQHTIKAFHAIVRLKNSFLSEKFSNDSRILESAAPRKSSQLTNGGVSVIASINNEQYDVGNRSSTTATATTTATASSTPRESRMSSHDPVTPAKLLQAAHKRATIAVSDASPRDIESVEGGALCCCCWQGAEALEDEVYRERFRRYCIARFKKIDVDNSSELDRDEFRLFLIDLNLMRGPPDSVLEKIVDDLTEREKVQGWIGPLSINGLRKAIKKIEAIPKLKQTVGQQRELENSNVKLKKLEILIPLKFAHDAFLCGHEKHPTVNVHELAEAEMKDRYFINMINEDTDADMSLRIRKKKADSWHNRPENETEKAIREEENQQIVDWMIEQVDGSNDGTINIDEFVEALTTVTDEANKLHEKEEEHESVENLMSVVERMWMTINENEFDPDATVTTQNLYNALRPYHEDFTFDDAQSLMMIHDDNGDGRLNLEEFRELVEKCFGEF